MLLHTWLPATLRGAGIKVVETAGWTTRSHGALPSLVKIVWHHDASPPGDSPGALNWMIQNWNNSSAQIWVDNYGTWHLVGTGIAWHAGKVKPGMPGNMDGVGIETDQTTGEAWPKAQLDSLRKGTAAIFKKQAVSSSWLHFHKTICDPPGRKVDPTGLDLTMERSNVGNLMSGSTTPPPAANTPPAAKPPTGAPSPTDPKWDEMATKAEVKAAMNEALAEYMPRALSAMLNGKPNGAVPAGSSAVLLDGIGTQGWATKAVHAARTGKPNAQFPDPGKPKD